MQAMLTEILEILDKGGTVGLMIALLAGGVKRWWVFGHHYREMKEDRDQWRMLALDGQTLSARAVKVLSTNMERPGA